MLRIATIIIKHMSHMAYFNLLARWQILRYGKFSQEKRYQYMSNWGQKVLASAGIKVDYKGKFPDQPGIVVANHVGFLDIPMLLHICPLSFVLKAELKRWPILGTASRLSSYIFIKRDQPNSREYAAQQIAKKVLEEKERVLVFPSGTTGLAGTKPWRQGCFKIAQREGLPIYPVRLTFDPPESATFVGNDLFFPKLIQLLRSPPRYVGVEVFPAEKISDAAADCARIQSLCEGTV